MRYDSVAPDSELLDLHCSGHWPLATLATGHWPLLDLQLSIPPRLSPADDRLVRGFSALAGGAALGQLAGRADRVAAALGAAFAAAVRMVDRVHRRAADVRAAAQPTLPSGLAQHDAHVIGVADRADRRPARGRHAANFAAGQIDLRPIGVAGGQRGAHARRPAQHAAPARLHLDVVNVHAQGEWPTAAGNCPRPPARRLRFGPASPAFKPFGGKDVALFAVDVMQQGDPGAAVRDRTGSNRPRRARRPCCGGSRSAAIAACGRRRDAAR